MIIMVITMIRATVIAMVATTIATMIGAITVILMLVATVWLPVLIARTIGPGNAGNQ
jgi:uncharacterized ion transporter superfamily protein YfcC